MSIMNKHSGWINVPNFGLWVINQFRGKLGKESLLICRVTIFFDEESGKSNNVFRMKFFQIFPKPENRNTLIQKSQN